MIDQTKPPSPFCVAVTAFAERVAAWLGSDDADIPERVPWRDRFDLAAAIVEAARTGAALPGESEGT